MLPPLTQTHHSYHYDHIKRATEAEKQSNMSAAAALLRKDADEDEIVDVKVTCDATWQKRGHQSLYGVVVVASWDTSQVLDTEVLSKWCHECNAKRHLDPTSEQFLDWWEGHQHLCGQNFYGSAGSMEAEGALNIWKRSVEKHKLRYTAMIADGDSSTYPTSVMPSHMEIATPSSNMNVLGMFRKECMPTSRRPRQSHTLGWMANE